MGPGISAQGKVEDVAVTPLVSGFRDFASQEVVLDIDYSIALEEYAKLAKKKSGAATNSSTQQPGMSVVIPIGELALIRRYNEELADSFV